MAGQTPDRATQSDTVGNSGSVEPPISPDAARLELQKDAARLYAQGYKRPQIARIMVKRLYPYTEFEDGLQIPLEQRLNAARNKLKRWETQEKFRDLIWQNGLAKLDLEGPAILRGVAKKARQGRVDAARLALEVTGRHNPKGDQQPAQIVVAFSGVPRPARIKADGQEITLEGELVEEEDE